MVRFGNLTLQPGDILLYKGKGLFSWLIRVKTGGHYSHCEVYVKNHRVWASRNGIGVNEYNFSSECLKAVIRPNGQLNWTDATWWFEHVAKGQKYDWVGLLNFYIAKWQGRENNRMFCSEFIVRLFRVLGCALFPLWVDADGIAPSDLPHTSMGTLYKE